MDPVAQKALEKLHDANENLQKAIKLSQDKEETMT